MILTIAPARVRLAHRIRFAVLALVALVSAHTIVYAGQAGGSASRFAAAMSSAGHDGWWAPASAVVVAAAAAVALRSLGALHRIETAAGAVGAVEPAASADPVVPFRSELLAIWRRLLPTVVALFAIQENVEGVLAHGRLPGIDILVGPGAALVLPTLAAVSLAVALTGALVRWRIARLEARIHRAAAAVRRIVRAERATGRWRAIGDLAPQRWIADRLDAGRAPPLAVRP